MKPLKTNKIKLNKQTVSNLEMKELYGGATNLSACVTDCVACPTYQRSDNTQCALCPTYIARACATDPLYC